MNALHRFPAAANDAGYIARIELANADWVDYDLLHARMADLGFLKQVTADDGRIFRLPDAEYYGRSHLPIEQLRDALQYTAESVKPGASVLVTEAPRMAWKLPVAR